MTRIDALRRFLLPCLHPSATSPIHPSTTTAAAAVNTPKKRLSTSLRDDIVDVIIAPKKKNEEEEEEENHNQLAESPEPSTPKVSVNSAPPRPSKTMVIGTIFGHRRGGHVWFCVQHDRINTRPSLLLELSIPTTTLIQEMGSGGLVRIALEYKDQSPATELSRCPLHSIPVWTLFCNGRKLGFAVRRKATAQNRLMLKTLQSITVGAGVIPSGSGPGPGTGNGNSSEEVMYMRANYEFVIGSADSESFHLINPDDGPGQELSFFLLRTR